MTTKTETVIQFFNRELVPAQYSQLGPDSINTYRTWLRTLSVFLNREATLADLNAETYAEYAAWVQGNRYSQAVMSRAPRLIRAVWSHAHAAGAITEAQPAKVSRQRQIMGEPAPMTEENKRRGKRKFRGTWDLSTPRDKVLAIAKVTESTLLVDFIEVYVNVRNAERPLGHELSKRTPEHLLNCAKRFSRSLGRRATIGDLTAENINGLLLEDAAAKLSPYSLKSRRTGLLVLWRCAHRLGALPDGPSFVRTIHCPGLEVEGYAVEEVEALLGAASAMRFEVRETGIPCRLYWGSALRVMWDLGLRAGDILAIATNTYSKSGRLWVMEHKTGKSGWHALRPSTSEAIAECIASTGARKLIWPAYTRHSFYRAFARLAAAAGLPGTSRWMRSGSGSAVEAANPGNGWRFLNHSAPSVFEKHYRIEAVCQAEPIMPPEVGAKGGAA